jgi:hypothetical protein
MACRDRADERFPLNFVVVTPGLIVFEAGPLGSSTVGNAFENRWQRTSCVIPQKKRGEQER